MTHETLHACYDIYRRRRLRSASQSTLRLHEIAQRHFSRFLGRTATIDDFTNENLEDFARFRLETDKVSPVTVNRDFSCLLALWRYMHRTGVVDRWPDVSLEPEPKRIPLAWTEQEMSAIVRAARSLRGKIGPYTAANWWTALILVCFDSAERIGAVRQLRWEYVSLQSRWITFPAESRKGRKCDNCVMISPDTVVALSKLHGYSTGEVFPWPYRETYIWNRYGKILEKAGLPNDRKRKFHCIRKTTASHLAKAGGDAMKLLTHTDSRVTANYLDPRIMGPTDARSLIPWSPSDT